MRIKDYILMNAAGEGAGAGGGAAANNGQPATSGTQGGNTAPPPAAPAIDAAAIAALVAKEIAKLGQPAAITPTPEPPPFPKESANGNGNGQQPSAQQQAIREIESLKAEMARIKQEADRAKSEAVQEKKMSAIASALAAFQFANGEAQLTAQRIFDSEITLDEKGQAVTPTGEPLKDYIAKQMNDSRAFLLAPSRGSGFDTPSSRTAGGNAVPDIDSIKPGMTAEAKKAVYERIADLSRRR